MRTKKIDKKQRLNQSKGITLIALVITIIVLLILAGVSIATLTGENGILTQANDAKMETTKAEAREIIQLEAAASFNNTGKYDKELAKSNLKANLGITDADIKDKGNGTLIVKLDGYEFKIDENGKVVENVLPKTVKEAKEKETIFEENTKLTDTYGNTITIPEGFKIASDSAIDVAQGVVIEDATYEGTKGSQFVWISVGTVTGKVNGVEKTETITLGRYSFNSTTGNPSAYTGDFVEENAKDTTNLKNYGNSIAEDIEAFKSSTGADKNGGYYIGRYEAGVTDYDSVSISNSSSLKSWTGYTRTDGKDAQIVCKQGQQVWNYITQNKSSELSKNMYSSDLTFTSDLINSYAWDTAIVFIQKFGDKEYSSTYSYQVGSLKETTKPSLTASGILSDRNELDKQCNIFDMAGNTFEWSTETYSYSNYPCVGRGGHYDNSSGHTSDRGDLYTFSSGSNISFRPLLYL